MSSERCKSAGEKQLKEKHNFIGLGRCICIYKIDQCTVNGRRLTQKVISNASFGGFSKLLNNQECPNEELL